MSYIKIMELLLYAKFQIRDGIFTIFTTHCSSNRDNNGPTSGLAIDFERREKSS